MRNYSSRDMARIGCHDCKGCSKCCCNMGQSIVLNPYDVYLMSEHMGLSFVELLAGPLELSSEAGIVHPNLRMIDSLAGPRCGFLDADSRCSIHAFRPGICRLFPLGRDYADGTISYFVLEEACPAQGKTKEKIASWLGFSSDAALKRYESFLLDWHLFIKGKREEIYASGEMAQAVAKEISAKILDTFYIKPYERFYEEVAERMLKG